MEFIGLAVLVLIPIIYVVVSVLQTESASFATRQAAREAARAFVTADSFSDAQQRAGAAARLAFEGHGIRVSPTVSFHVGRSCSGALPTTITPGTEITACLSADLPLPMFDRLGSSHLRASHTFTVDVYRAQLQ